MSNSEEITQKRKKNVTIVRINFMLLNDIDANLKKKIKPKEN